MKGDKYVIVDSLQSAVDTISCVENPRVVAGGTDLVANINLGLYGENITLIDISRIPDLHTIKLENDKIIIGACVSLETLSKHPNINNIMPFIGESASLIASPVVRKNATIAGNLLCDTRCVFYNQPEEWRYKHGSCLKAGGSTCYATGSKKKCYAVCVSDMAPCLLATNSSLAIVSPAGKKHMPLASLYTGDGKSPFSLDKHDIITHIIVPVIPWDKYMVRKYRYGEETDFPWITVCVIQRQDNLMIGMNGIGSAPLVWRGTLSQYPTFATEIKKRTAIVDNLNIGRTYHKELLTWIISELIPDEFGIHS